MRDQGSVDARIPLLLTLREHFSDEKGRRRTLVECLADVCKSPLQLQPPKHSIEYMLLNNRAVVIFDGLDELLDINTRRQAVDAIQGFAHLYPNVTIIVTSRKIGYEETPLDPVVFCECQLAEFDNKQVAKYAENWFRLDQEMNGTINGSLATSFIRDSEIVEDLRTNPLMLSLMCGLYNAEGYIPANRPDVYEKCGILLFERWTVNVAF